MTSFATSDAGGVAGGGVDGSYFFHIFFLFSGAVLTPTPDNVCTLRAKL
jgi:hypothetical protein